jgi:beta-carotene 3-hydroxylase
MALCLYGFFTPNILGGVCFGAGLGITLFGIMYMFIHDGLVHRCVGGGTAVAACRLKCQL